MSDKLEWIKARHEAGCFDSAVDDREWLLSDIERLTQQNAALAQAVGLLTTLAPSMEIDPADPVRMAQQVLAEVERMRAEAERQAWWLRARQAVVIAEPLTYPVDPDADV